MAEEDLDGKEPEIPETGNEVPKMKLMREGNGYFHAASSMHGWPPEVENEFLKNIAAFEREWRKCRTITVYDKIHRPVHFRPVQEIGDHEINHAWNELKDHLERHGITVDACSPNITVRELYRFTTEELFLQEMNDIHVPGMICGFIYDEFHPDPAYDNSRLVKEELFEAIFSKGKLDRDSGYSKKDLLFNEKRYPDFSDFMHRINRFKSIFEKLCLEELAIHISEVDHNICTIAGYYGASARAGMNQTRFEGRFRVILNRDELGYWLMKDIQMEGFALH